MSTKHDSAVEVFARVSHGLDEQPVHTSASFRRTRVWSYGDVENSGVYYHPQLTHYAHQVFEEFFRERGALNYVDLSRDSESSENLRKSRNIPRLTFPVEWLHQFMRRPMFAGDAYEIALDTIDVDQRTVAVRGWVLDHT